MGEENGWLGKRDLNLGLGASLHKAGNHHAEEQLAISIKVHFVNQLHIFPLLSLNMQIILEN